MITAFELAGYFASHAIWSVSDSPEPFTPMLASSGEGGRELQRFVTGDLQGAVEKARAALDANELAAWDGVLLFDGRISLGDRKYDAVIIELRSYAFPGAEATLAVPYTPPSSGRFKVHKPKLLRWHACDDFDQTSAIQAFFEGVDAHEEGRKVWAAALDESV